jgi:hypothetical protein
MSVLGQYSGINKESREDSGGIAGVLKYIGADLGLDMNIFNNPEGNLKKSITNFGKEYTKRKDYYITTDADNLTWHTIKQAIEEVIDRATIILSENETLTFFYPFKKKDNRKKINYILTLLDTMMNKIDLSQGVWGERINLQQNTLISLESLERRLDIIESDIEKSTILSKVLGL